MKTNNATSIDTNLITNTKNKLSSKIRIYNKENT